MPDSLLKNVISNKDPMTLNSFDEIVAEIECSLFNLKFLALTTNFSNVVEHKNYYDNVSYLKRFYERADSIGGI